MDFKSFGFVKVVISGNIKLIWVILNNEIISDRFVISKIEWCFEFVRML